MKTQSLLNSQFVPMSPTLQKHVKPLILSMQVPCRHGLEIHSLISLKEMQRIEHLSINIKYMIGYKTYFRLYIHESET